MNSNLDGSAPEPDHPTECIQLPEPPKPVKEASTPWFVNDVAEITWEQWKNLRPLGCSPEQWSSPDVAFPFRAQVSGVFGREKCAKIFPISWARFKEIVDLEWLRWNELNAFEENLRSMAGLRGMKWDDAQDLIKDCVARNGSTWDRFKAVPATLNICHRIANAAHRRGAQEMQEIMQKKHEEFSATRASRMRTEMMSQALGEQAALFGLDVVATALKQDVPLPVPPSSIAWQAARSEQISGPEEGPENWDEFFDKHVDPDRP